MASGKYSRHFGYKKSHFGQDTYGHELMAYGATTGKYFKWDQASDKVVLAGNLEVTGTVTQTGAPTITGNLTVVGNTLLKGTVGTGTNGTEFTVSAAGVVVAGSTVKSTGDFTVGADKFVVTAASGNTLLKGTIGAGANGTEFTVSSAGAVVAASTVKSTGDFTVGADKLVVTAASGDTLLKGTIGAGANGTEFTVSSAGAVVAASTVKSTGDFTVGADKLVVTAASGNTLLKGTIGAGANGTEFTVSSAGAVVAASTVKSTGDFTVGADKLVVTAASGNTLLKGTIGAGANGTEFTVSSAGAVLAASTVKSTGDFTVGADKFVVTAASGNTLLKGTIGAGTNGTEFTVDASGNTAVGGTLGVTGVATLSGGAIGALFYDDTADGTIPAYRLVEVNSGGETVVGTVDSHTVVGANFENAEKTAAQAMKVAYHKASLVAATPLKGGHLIKCADNGRATHLVTAALAGTTLETSEVGSAFANQPANDTVTVVSSSAADDDQTCTIIGTTEGGVVVVTETVTLTGTVDVNTTKTDWGVILAVKLSAECAGTVEISENSGGLAITTLTTGVLSKGVDEVAAASQGAYNVAPTVQGSDTTTKTVGVKYVNAAAADAYQGVALTDATAVAFGTAALLVSELYTGDLENTRTCILKVGAEEDEMHGIGYATADATVGATFTGILTK